MNAFNSMFATLLIAALSAGCMAAPAGADDDRGYLLLAQAGDAGERVDDADEQLKLAALEGLLSASPERALPLVKKVLAGTHSDAVKSRALFVLSQIGTPEADTILVDLARDPDQPLQRDAIRMIGISGASDSVAQLTEIYRSGDADIRESVLNAYLIAGDTAAVYEIARTSEPGDEFNSAVQVLAAMGATEELRLLADKDGSSKGLIHALAVSGDLEGLQKIVAQAGDAEERISAISAIGIVGGNDANAALVDIYRDARDDDSKDAALQGLLISGYDEGVMQLFRASQDPGEKRKLLRTLVHMDSDLALELIDATLEGN